MAWYGRRWKRETSDVLDFLQREMLMLQARTVARTELVGVQADVAALRAAPDLSAAITTLEDRIVGIEAVLKQVSDAVAVQPSPASDEIVAGVQTDLERVRAELRRLEVNLTSRIDHVKSRLDDDTGDVVIDLRSLPRRDDESAPAAGERLASRQRQPSRR